MTDSTAEDTSANRINESVRIRNLEPEKIPRIYRALVDELEAYEYDVQFGTSSYSVKLHVENEEDFKAIETLWPDKGTLLSRLYLETDELSVEMKN